VTTNGSAPCGNEKANGTTEDERRALKRSWRHARVVMRFRSTVETLLAFSLYCEGRDGVVVVVVIILCLFFLLLHCREIRQEIWISVPGIVSPCAWRTWLRRNGAIDSREESGVFMIRFSGSERGCKRERRRVRNGV
jgi:hypothetical protein